MDWFRFWMGWSGVFIQLIAIAWWMWDRACWRRRATIELCQAGIDRANEQCAFLLAYGWYWGAEFERREWMARLTGGML